MHYDQSLCYFTSIIDIQHLGHNGNDLFCSKFWHGARFAPQSKNYSVRSVSTTSSLHRRQVAMPCLEICLYTAWPVQDEQKGKLRCTNVNNYFYLPFWIFSSFVRNFGPQFFLIWNEKVQISKAGNSCCVYTRYANHIVSTVSTVYAAFEDR